MAAVLGQQVMSLARNLLGGRRESLSSDSVTHNCEAVDFYPSPRLPEFTLDEVSWHCQYNDCWMIIYDKVYNMTEFLTQHPGGFDVLLENAGRDATWAFRSVNHSDDALRMMEPYCLGILVPHERLYTNKALSIFS